MTILFLSAFLCWVTPESHFEAITATSPPMQDNEFEGVVQHITDHSSGISSSGKKWTRTIMIIRTTNGSYDIHLAMTCWNLLEIPSPGDRVRARISLESREYRGIWYTTATAYSVTLIRNIVPTKRTRTFQRPPKYDEAPF